MRENLLKKSDTHSCDPKLVCLFKRRSKKIIPDFHGGTEGTSFPRPLIQPKKTLKARRNKIIHRRRRRGELQFGFRQSYENEKEPPPPPPPPRRGTLLSYDSEAFIARPCQINLRRPSKERYQSQVCSPRWRDGFQAYDMIRRQNPSSI